MAQHSGPDTAPICPASGRPAIPQGSPLVLTPNTLAAPAADTVQLSRWASKYQAAKILRKHDDAKIAALGKRISHCGYVAHQSFVDLQADPSAGKAGFAGLKTCGNVWCCPVCSARISEKRKDELNALLARSRAAGFSVLMLTQTFSHRRGDSLPVILAAFKDAQRRFRQRRDWKALASVVVGSVSALELTHGANGWHPHSHILLVCKGDPAAAFKSVNALRSGWLASLASAGLTGGKAAWQLQDASAAGSYVAKWGAAEELALGGVKSARGGSRTPFQLLEDVAIDRCRRSAALFAEYAAAMRGKRQLIWSNGLKAMFAIDDLSDDQAAQEIDPAEVPAPAVVRTWAVSAWRHARRRRVALLHAARTGGNLDAAEYGPADAVRWSDHVAESVVLGPD